MQKCIQQQEHIMAPNFIYVLAAVATPFAIFMGALGYVQLITRTHS